VLVLEQVVKARRAADHAGVAALCLLTTGVADEDDSEVEHLLQQVAEARHAGDRRDAMSQLSSLLTDNPRVSGFMPQASSVMPDKPHSFTA
jgi:hypothetical protein